MDDKEDIITPPSKTDSDSREDYRGRYKRYKDLYYQLKKENERLKKRFKDSNNWTDQNEHTLRNWKTSISKASFIYEVIQEKYRKIVNKFLLIALILSVISTVISAISSAILTIDDKTYEWIAFSCNILLFLITGTITILNGAIKITKWDEFVTRLSTFIEKLDSFYAIVSNELVLPKVLRQDAIVFIKDQSKNYLSIMQQSPDVFPSDYNIANQKYRQFAEGNIANFKFAQKYNEDDGVIDIV